MSLSGNEHDPVRATYVEWNVDDGVTDYLPAMRTDITLSKGHRFLIIDTKYYNQAFQHNPIYNKKTIHSDNLYQIYSYVKNKDVGATGNVSGILLYAKTDEEIAPDFTYSISGNQISVKSLDLGSDFSNLSSQLNALVVPLLVKTDAEYGKARYYSEPVHVNGADYVMCSQWIERPDNNDRPYLMRWIREHQ